MFPIKMVIFHRKMLVYQRAIEDSEDDMNGFKKMSWGLSPTLWKMDENGVEMGENPDPWPTRENDQLISGDAGDSWYSIITKNHRDE